MIIVFPRFFVLSCDNVVTTQELLGGNAIVGLDFAVSDWKVNGRYPPSKFKADHSNRSFCSSKTVNIGGVEKKMLIGKVEDDWAIFCTSRAGAKILWRNPYSASMSLPPKKGWEPVHELAHGEPYIRQYSY